MRSVVVAILLFTFLGFHTALFAQLVPDNDTSEARHQYLPEITIAGRSTKRDMIQLPEVLGTSIYAGKKNALIILDHVKGNVVNNTMRPSESQSMPVTPMQPVLLPEQEPTVMLGKLTTVWV